MSEIKLNPSVLEEVPDMAFYTKEGQSIEVSTATFDKGKLVEILDTEGDIRKDFEYSRELLKVPGYGFIRPGTHIIWKDLEFVLEFGWHRNTSNQELYSWYLSPVNREETLQIKTEYDSLSLPRVSTIRTLTRPMISEITKVILS